MDKKETLDAMLKGKLDVKRALGDISTRDIAEAQFDFSKEITKFANEKIIAIVTTTEAQSEDEGILRAIFFRMYFWMKSLIELDNKNHIQAVAVILRSMFELFLDLKLLISNEEGNCFDKYKAFSEIEMFKEGKRKVQFIEEHYPEKKDKIFLRKQYIENQERIDRITINLKNYWEIDSISDIGKLRHWTKKDAAQRALDVGLEYKEMYVEYYSQLSSIAHGSYLEFFRRLQSEHFESFYSYCHEAAQRIFIEAIKTFASKLEIDKAWERDGFYKLLDKLKNENMWRFLIYKLEKLGEQEKSKGESKTS